MAQPTLTEVRLKTAPCVPAIREKVQAWILGGYKGATDTSRALLRHWFHTAHRIGGRKFEYHIAQREAVQTLVYLFEVAKVRRVTKLIETFSAQADLKLLSHDEFARYCLKMATGSGKTKVMSLVIAWQYLNACCETSGAEYAKTFLIIAPNVIVFERLRSDFEGGFVFRTDPVIPAEFKTFWDMNYYVRGDAERTSSEGALYLTNIQQLYEKDEAKSDEPDALAAMMGSKPPAKVQTAEDFPPRIARRGGPIAVLNDEAHHTHDEDLAWNECIRRLHAAAPLAGQFDFSATPRHTKGELFAWTVYDYPLKQAMIDRIVKQPVKGVMKGIGEKPSAIASVRYDAYLVAGVERWKEYCVQLKPLGKKPLLFVMLNDTKEADEVGDFLQRRYPESFAGDKLLVIHTDRRGDVVKKDIGVLRETARHVDRGSSPVNAIVSVMMLREGWDVQNVTVIVGLRPYSSKANILPEQTVGRGLRLMFRGDTDAYTERVDIIGNKTFIEFVEQLEREEDFKLDEFEVGEDKVVIVHIAVDEAKRAMDIAVPDLTPILVRKSSLEQEIAALDIPALDRPLPVKEDSKEAREFRYEGHDLITMQKLFDRDYTIPTPQTAEEVIGYYAKRIAEAVKLPSQFAALAPKVREFLEESAFGRKVQLNTAEMVKAISTNVASYMTITSFVKALRKLVVDELEPALRSAGKPLSTTVPFPWSRPTVKAKKCLFNLVPCLNKLEESFAKFLEKADDIVRFSKLPEKFGFIVEYTDSMSNLRHYEPDFVAVDAGGVHYLIETKGQENIDVAHKDRAATLWAENATALTGTPWVYLKVLQSVYEKLEPTEFADLLNAR